MSARYRHFISPSIAVFLLVIGVVAGIVLVQTPQQFHEQAAPATTLFISPSGQNKSAGETVNFSVLANTGSNQVIGMDLVVSYDPAVLTVTSISKGSDASSFDSVIRNAIDNSAGTITYSLFTVDKLKAITGTNLDILDIVATVRPTAAYGNSSIAFLPQTSVAAVLEGQNVIASKVNGTITIGQSSNGTATAAPTQASAPAATSSPTNDTSSTTADVVVSSTKNGDLNGDGKINILDLSVVLSNFLKTAGSSDLNGDGKTNILDLSIVLSNWGK